MSEIVDRVAYALFYSKLNGLPPEVIERAWSTACTLKDECVADAKTAVDAVKVWQQAPVVAVANDPPKPLRFPLKSETLPSAQRVELGAVAGHSGWFWWEQIQPPNGVTIDYRRVTAMHITHRIPSSQSPVSLQGLMWKLAE